MSEQIEAIYDNGVFKPLVPLSLPDKAHVRLTVESAAAPPANGTNDAKVSQPAEFDALAGQKAALEELRREIGQLPQTRNNDGWSVRQHDELLYGGNK